MFKAWHPLLIRRSYSVGRRPLCDGTHHAGQNSVTLESGRQAVKNQKAHQELKYADKLLRKMKEEGVNDLAQLKAKLAPSQHPGTSHSPATAVTPAIPQARGRQQPNIPFQAKREGRSDSSPLKPLHQILNIDRILEKPHTADIIHSLWTAYHVSRASESGRGYLSATMPKATYLDMLSSAQKYPLFVLPLPRNQEGESIPAWEFHLMEWAVFPPPPPPRLSSDLFPSFLPSPNPPSSTILFTPLQEYKLHQSFAQPYLILSHYTDLADSHNIVLLRGEITPSANKPSSYLLTQQDAQRLALGVQQYYLSSLRRESSRSPAEVERHTARRQLLLNFHEDKENFQWEKLLDVTWDV